jgi:hypothetical protein
MLPTYPAILRGGSLDWGEGGPPPLPPGDVPVHVTLLVPGTAKANGPAMAAALEALATAGGPEGIDDPDGWQREVRADRPPARPGRMIFDSNLIIYAARPEYPGLRRLIAASSPAVSAVSVVEVLGYHKLAAADRLGIYEDILLFIRKSRMSPFFLFSFRAAA